MAKLGGSSVVLLTALCALLWAQPAFAATARGSAAAIDGDSIIVGNREVRLYGIDAPEFQQACSRNGADWACGKEARDQLAALLTGAIVDCQGLGVDIHNRLLAVCRAGGIELNQMMVEHGWALALRSETDAYVLAETRAKSARIGIWTSTFVSPAEFRGVALPTDPFPPRSVQRPTVQNVQRREPADAEVGCAIKGNRSRRGEWIYYLPGMQYYNETNPEEIFCSEAAARAAGYRRSRAPRIQ
jgi:endonuclease YncB( thermonuclease family)